MFLEILSGIVIVSGLFSDNLFDNLLSKSVKINHFDILVWNKRTRKWWNSITSHQSGVCILIILIIWKMKCYGYGCYVTKKTFRSLWFSLETQVSGSLWTESLADWNSMCSPRKGVEQNAKQNSQGAPRCQATGPSPPRPHPRKHRRQAAVRDTRNKVPALASPACCTTDLVLQRKQLRQNYAPFSTFIPQARSLHSISQPWAIFHGCALWALKTSRWFRSPYKAGQRGSESATIFAWRKGIP